MTEIAYKCQHIHVTMTHGMFYLKTCPRPTFVTKVRHGTQLLAHASNSFGCIRTWARSAQVFLYKNDYAGREAPRYSNKKQDPQREALWHSNKKQDPQREALWHSNKKLDTRREAPMRRNKKLTLGVLKRVSSLQALPVGAIALLEALYAKHVLIDFTVSFTFGTIKSATL